MSDKTIAEVQPITPRRATMELHQARVIQEREELVTKWTKLGQFIDEKNDTYRELPLMEKERLNLQAYLMGKYMTVLQDRIDYFTEI
jgi:hypothetical protein